MSAVNSHLTSKNLVTAQLPIEKRLAQIPVHTPSWNLLMILKTAKDMPGANASTQTICSTSVKYTYSSPLGIFCHIFELKWKIPNMHTTSWYKLQQTAMIDLKLDLVHHCQAWRVGLTWVCPSLLSYTAAPMHTLACTCHMENQHHRLHSSAYTSLRVRA